MNQSEQINELAAALSKAQGTITPALRDSTNPFFKSKYADLSNIWGACKAALAENGLAVLQTMDCKEDKIFLMTTLAHSSGQWIRSCLPIMPTKNDAQGIGSAITYMRRYSLAAMVGVTTDEDDDGNAASGGARQSDHHRASAVATPPSISALITVAQAKQLRDLFFKCDPVYCTQIMTRLKQSVHSVESIEQIPCSLFESVRNSAVKNAEEYQKQASFDTVEHQGLAVAHG